MVLSSIFGAESKMQKCRKPSFAKAVEGILRSLCLRLRSFLLANLAPDIVKVIWENRQPVSLTLEKLRRGIPDSWEEQRKLFL